MSYYTGGNILSFLAFFIWIPVALYGMRRWPPAMATAVLFFGGLLLLPEVMFFKLPGLLEFAKLEIIATWLFIGAAIFHRERLASAPKSWWFRVCVVVLLIGSVSTVLLNTDGFRVASRYVPGQVPYDATHAVIGALLSVVVPFYLGSAMFGGSRDLRVLLTTMVVACTFRKRLQTFWHKRAGHSGRQTGEELWKRSHTLKRPRLSDVARRSAAALPMCTMVVVACPVGCSCPLRVFAEGRRGMDRTHGRTQPRWQGRIDMCFCCVATSCAAHEDIVMAVIWICVSSNKSSVCIWEAPRGRRPDGRTKWG